MEQVTAAAGRFEAAASAQTRRFYLAGEWRDSSEQAEVRSPYDGHLAARIALASEGDADEAVQRATAAFPVARKLSAAQRSAILKAVHRSVLERRAEIERTVVEESGKPIQQARMEVERGLCTLELASEEAKRIGGELIPFDLLPAAANKFGVTRRVPLGPVLGIPAFNFPFNLVAHKVAPPFAAGNPVILKPAPQTPLTALLLAEIFADAGTPPGMLSVLPCRNEVAERLVTHDGIKAITFTGSSAVGWRLKGLSGKKKVLLELGGNAAVIIDRDADVPHAARSCALAAFAYAGQVCVSLQRIYIQDGVYAEFVRQLVNATEGLTMGDPMDAATQIGPMISPAAAERAEALLAEAVAAGARVLTGGERKGSMLAPTVLENVGPTLRVCQEEAFAPIVTVSPFHSFDEAIRMANSTAYGLQAGVFTGSLRHVLQAFDEIEVGSLMVNDATLFRADNGPFGGFKDSGIGRESVRETIQQMTETKLLVLSS